MLWGRDDPVWDLDCRWKERIYDNMPPSLIESNKRENFMFADKFAMI